MRATMITIGVEVAGFVVAAEVCEDVLGGVVQPVVVVEDSLPKTPNSKLAWKQMVKEVQRHQSKLL